MQETARYRTADDARRTAEVYAERAADLLEQDYDGTAAAVTADMRAHAFEAIACTLFAIEARLEVLAHEVRR